MTVELVQGTKGQGPFVWPAEPDDLEKQKKAQDTKDKEQEVRRMRARQDEAYKLEPADATGLKERARLLLRGKVRWRPSWEENGGTAVEAMGRGKKG